MVTFRNFLLPAGFILLFSAEILRMYLVMPYPGSQQDNTIGFAYFLHRNMLLIRIITFIMIGTGAYPIYRKWKSWKKAGFISGIILYLALFYLVTFILPAEKNFPPLQNKIFSSASHQSAPGSTVIGITHNGESKAYPVSILNFHHLLHDSIGGMPIIITYCKNCGEAGVFHSLVNDRNTIFRLAAKDHYKIILEDQATGTWWRQSTGAALAGPLKGSILKRIPFSLTSIENWLAANPRSAVLQPDPAFSKKYHNQEGTNHSGQRNFLNPY